MLHLHQGWQGLAAGHLHLPKPLPELGSDELQAQPGVERRLIRELLNPTRLVIRDPVLVQREAHSVCQLSEAYVVLTAPREILDEGAVAVVVHHAQVHLKAAVDNNAPLGGAMRQDLLHHRHLHKGVYDRRRVVRGPHDVHVSYGLLPPTEAAGRVQLVNPGARPPESVHDLLRHAQSAAYGNTPVLCAERADVPEYVLRGLLPKTRHSGQAALHYRLFQGLHRGYAHLLADAQGRLGPYAGHVHEGQNAVRKLPLQVLQVLQGPRAHHLPDLAGNGLSDARNLPEVSLFFDHLGQLYGQMLDCAGGSLVSPYGERRVALQRQESGDLLEGLGHLRVVHAFRPLPLTLTMKRMQRSSAENAGESS